MKILKHWSVNLIRGLSALMLAMLLLINGQGSIQSFTQFLGIFWLIIGLTYLMNAREDQKLKPLMLTSHRCWLICVLRARPRKSGNWETA